MELLRHEFVSRPDAPLARTYEPTLWYVPLQHTYLFSLRLFFSLSLPFYELLNSLPLPTHNVIDKTVHRCNWRVSVRGSLGRPGSIVTGLPLFGGSATPCASPPPRPYVFLIILFGSTTLLTGMTGIFLHMQWPLTSQSHGSDSQREQLVFHYVSNSMQPGCLLNRCSRDFISLGQWCWSKCPYECASRG
jgi:hypothetical protein